MKNVWLIGLIITVAAISGCADNISSDNIIGTWEGRDAPFDKILLTFNSDGSYSQVAYILDGHLKPEQGKYRLEGSKIKWVNEQNGETGYWALTFINETNIMIDGIKYSRNQSAENPLNPTSTTPIYILPKPQYSPSKTKTPYPTASPTPLPTPIIETQEKPQIDLKIGDTAIIDNLKFTLNDIYLEPDSLLDNNNNLFVNMTVTNMGTANRWFENVGLHFGADINCYIQDSRNTKYTPDSIRMRPKFKDALEPGETHTFDFVFKDEATPSTGVKFICESYRRNKNDIELVSYVEYDI